MPSALAVFEVDDQLVLGRRLHWQVGGLLSFENAIDISSRALVHLPGIMPVGGKAPARRVVSEPNMAARTLPASAWHRGRKL